MSEFLILILIVFVFFHGKRIKKIEQDNAQKNSEIRLLQELVTQLRLDLQSLNKDVKNISKSDIVNNSDNIDDIYSTYKENNLGDIKHSFASYQEKPPIIPSADVTSSYQSSTDKKSAVKKKKSLEDLIGTNIVGVVASILILISAIAFGTIVYHLLSDMMRMVLMFLISFAITAVGLVLVDKKPSNFASVLAGCGFGTVFISILIAHLYFKAFNDIVAYTLLLVWCAVIFFLPEHLMDKILAFVAHLGAGVSVLFAIKYSLSYDNMLIISVYNLFMISIIIMGNRRFDKQRYTFSLYLSQLINIISTLAIVNVIDGAIPLNEALYDFKSIIAIAVFIISSTVIYYFISSEILRDSNEDTDKKAVNSSTDSNAIYNKGVSRSILSKLNSFSLADFMSKLNGENEDGENKTIASNKLLSAIMWIVNIHFGVFSLFEAQFINYFKSNNSIALFNARQNLNTMSSMSYEWYFAQICAGIITFSIICLIIYIISILERNLNSTNNSKLYMEASRLISASLYSAYILAKAYNFGVIYLIRYESFEMFSFLFVIALPMLIMYKLRGLKVYTGLALFYVVVDSFYSVFNFMKAGIFPSFIYMLAILSLYMAIGYLRHANIFNYRNSIYLFLNISLFVIFMFKEWYKVIRPEYVLMLLTVISIAFNLVQWYREKLLDKTSDVIYGTKICMMLFEAVLMLGNLIYMNFAKYSYADVHIFSYWTISILTLTLSFVRLKAELESDTKGYMGLWHGIKFTFIVMACFNALSNSINEGFIFSVVCMLTALIAIVGGFRFKSKPLRVYGLLLTMICVLKMVTFDIGMYNSMMRVFAFFAGGVICFAISAIYNYFNKRIE